MQKSKLSNFINKYYLNGQGSESVLIHFNEDNLKVSFYGPNKTMLGFVKLNDGLDIGSVGVFQTPVLMKLLTAFNDTDDLEIIPMLNNAKDIAGLTIQSDAVRVYATTADPKIIPEVNLSSVDEDQMVLKTEPEIFEIEFDIDQVFMDQFKRYSGAAAAELFAFEVKNNQVEIIFNYSNNNVNQIKFSKSDAQVNSDSDFVICFNVAVFNEIFNNNKNFTGSIKVSKRGLCRVDMNNVDFDCRYYPYQVVLEN